MTTTTGGSPCIAGPTPAASTSTPAICTKVATRYSQSSVSKDVANQVKLIHAHQMAKKTKREGQDRRA